MPRPAEMAQLRGLPNPNTTPFPNCIVDEYLPYFTGAELKVILYLIRRTLGFHKTRDAISLSQICNGIVRKDGRRLDQGTGLHKSTACDALNSLISWGMIKRVTRRDPIRGDLPTEYVLWIEGDSESAVPTAPASPPTPRAPASSTAQRSRRERPGGGSPSLAPVSALSDTPLSGRPDIPVSVVADTPLSDLPDSPVSGEADKQDPARQEKDGWRTSNIRMANPRNLVGETHRSGTASGMETADEIRAGGAPTSGESSPRPGTGGRGATGDRLRAELHGFAEVVAREFSDQAPFRATLSRLVNLHRRAGLELEAFIECLDVARQRTKERTAAIRMCAGETSAGGPPRKNKMPYFFALLEEQLGLREAVRPATPPVPGEDAPTARSLPVVGAPREDRPRRRPLGAAQQSSAETAAVPALPSDTNPSPTSLEDARIIREVVRQFSRQFADYTVADALGEWAVNVWRQSGLSRQRFLEAAQAASVRLLRDRVNTPSVETFRAGLSCVLVQPAGDLSMDTPERVCS